MSMNATSKLILNTKICTQAIYPMHTFVEDCKERQRDPARSFPHNFSSPIELLLFIIQKMPHNLKKLHLLRLSNFPSCIYSTAHRSQPTATISNRRHGTSRSGPRYQLWLGFSSGAWVFDGRLSVADWSIQSVNAHSPYRVRITVPSILSLWSVEPAGNRLDGRLACRRRHLMYQLNACVGGRIFSNRLCIRLLLFGPFPTKLAVEFVCGRKSTRTNTPISQANSNMSTLERNRNGYYSFASAWYPGYNGSTRFYNSNGIATITTTTTSSQSFYNYWTTTSALLSPGGSSSNSSSGYEGGSGSASGNGSVNGCLWSTTPSRPTRTVQFPFGSTAPRPFPSATTPLGCQDRTPIALCSSFSSRAGGVATHPRQLHDQVGGLLLPDGRNEMERNANDPVYLLNLFSRTPVSKLAVILLRHLSLLKIDSTPAKIIYLKHLSKIIYAASANEFDKDECMQLILHFLIHPAILDEERLLLKIAAKQIFDGCFDGISPNDNFNGLPYLPQGLFDEESPHTSDFVNNNNNNNVHDELLSSSVVDESRLRNRCSSHHESEGRGTWSEDYNSSVSTLSSTRLNPIPTFDSPPMQTAATAPPPSSIPPSHCCQNRCLLTPNNHHINNFFTNNDFNANMVRINKPNVANKQSQKSSFTSNSSYNTDGTNYHCRPGPSGHMNMESGDTGDVFTLMNNFDSRYLADIYNYRRNNSPAATKVNFANAVNFEPAEEAMRDIPQWLKMLRLHKYTPLFSKISYDDMMTFSEEKLEALGVTKGARKKIVLSIEKLKQRAKTLKQLEKEGFYQSGSLRATLNELKCICLSPIRCYYPPNDGETEFDQEKIEGFESLPDEIDDDNIPAHFTRILGKICTQLLVTSEIEEDCVQICTEIMEKCANHPAFTEAQKKRLSNCRHELRKILYLSKAAMANDGMRGSSIPNNNRERRQHAQRKFSLQSIQHYNNNNNNGRNNDLASKSNVKRTAKNKRSNRPVDGQRFNRLPAVNVEFARVAEAEKPLTISCSNYNSYARPTAQTAATQSTNAFEMQPANNNNHHHYHHHSISNYATNVNPMFSTTTPVPQQATSIMDEKNSFIFSSDHQLSSWNNCASNFENTTKRNIGLSDNGFVNQGRRHSASNSLISDINNSTWDPINFSSGLDQLCRSITEAALEDSAQ
ncbi:Protein Smaug -like protein 2 [Trichinella pseudospiralis]|uniref:Protein Smaug-like protein 2 n=1 Tax=Trichinella pseudospiralis TaxID=6337 RepID=A0A0V1FF65_TRIPS|nr:Protein Smaug -like protein 2 [Trichinella pseudospiralis]